MIEETDEKKYVAKFSSTSDLYSVIKAEFISMRLAKICGIDVAEVHLKKSSKRDVLLVERFDRIRSSKGWERKCMVSALTLFELDEMMARYASYETLAEIIRHRFHDASKTLNELFKRMVFNILVGNTDDHARNHAAFWDGEMLSLTPAYDICPQSRSGNEASQAMLIDGENKMSKISVCINAARHFLLSRSEAIELTEHLIKTIVKNWEKVCDSAEVTPVDKKLFASRQFLNPYAFESLEKDCKHFEALVSKFKLEIE